jgi:hypothetical protein
MRAIKVLALALLMVAVIISGWFYLALIARFRPARLMVSGSPGICTHIRLTT